MEGELGIEPHRKHFAGYVKSLFEGGTQSLQQPVLYVPDRQQV
jgi:hypothetical protein